MWISDYIQDKEQWNRLTDKFGFTAAAVIDYINREAIAETQKAWKAPH